jgi:sugar lactone lactonase YvrE
MNFFFPFSLPRCGAIVSPRSFLRIARRSAPAIVLLSLSAFLTDRPLEAQSAHLSGSSRGALTAIGGGFNAPNGVAVDSSGNVFVADTGNSAVKEILAPGYTTTVRIAVAEGNFNEPNAIAIDRVGNLFVADEYTGVIKEITAASGYVTVMTLVSGFSFPTGVAVDNFGNLFVADLEANQVIEVTAASNYASKTPLSLGFSELIGVAVDGNGNLFTSDEINGIQESPASSGYTTQINLASGSQYIVETSGIALDIDGNLYYTDVALGEAFEIPLSSGYQSVVPVAQGFAEPEAIAVDNSGNVFVADPNSGSGAVDEIPAGAPAVGFGTAAIATSTPPTATLTFTFDEAGTIQAPVVLTEGATGQDFTSAGGSCVAGNYTVDQNCTVVVSFTPKFAGTRTGAVELLSSTGEVITTVYLSGTGSGPQIAFTPGTQSIPGSGFNAPKGVAVDGAGNIFVADTGNSAVKEIFAAGGYTVVRTLGSGFSAPQGIAVDGAGNVFVADTGNAAVKELPVEFGYSIVNTLEGRPSGLPLVYPTAVSVDGSGNVYVEDPFYDVVQEFLEVGGYTTVNTLHPNSATPSNTQASYNGNLYIADSANNRILKQDQIDGPTVSFSAVPVGSTSSDSPHTVQVQNVGNAALAFTGLSYPADFIEAAGDSSSCTSSTSLAAGAECDLPIDFMPVNGGSLSESLTLSDNSLNATSATQALTLKGTGLQTSQTISVTPITGTQIINSTISLSGTATSGLPVAFVSLTPSTCTVAGTLGGTWTASLIAAGECSIQARQWGNASYSAAPFVFQNFYVHLVSQSITFTTVAEPVYATNSVAIAATASSGLPVSFASTTPTICTVSETGGAWSALLKAGGRCTVQATQSGAGSLAPAPAISQTFTVNRNAQTISFPAIVEPVYVGGKITPAAIASSGLPVSYLSEHPSICAVVESGGVWSINLVSVGECSIEAQQGGSSLYNGAPFAFQNFYIHRNP